MLKVIDVWYILPVKLVCLFLRVCRLGRILIFFFAPSCARKKSNKYKILSNNLKDINVFLVKI